MNHQIVLDAISAVGFPIVGCIGMGYGFWKMYLRMCITLDKVTETNQELALTNSSLIKNIDLKIDTKIGTLENKMDKMGDKVDKIVQLEIENQK